MTTEKIKIWKRERIERYEDIQSDYDCVKDLDQERDLEDFYAEHSGDKFVKLSDYKALQEEIKRLKEEKDKIQKDYNDANTEATHFIKRFDEQKEEIKKLKEPCYLNTVDCPFAEELKQLREKIERIKEAYNSKSNSYTKDLLNVLKEELNKEMK